MDEPFAEYLDRMIGRIYVTRKFSGHVTINDPAEDSAASYIFDDATGRPVPIDDSADHFLLQSFDRARYELLTVPPPVGNGMNGLRNVAGLLEEGNEFCGEIQWRDMHVKPSKTRGQQRKEDE